MAINKKLIHFEKGESFDKEKEAGNILDTSICFIKDRQQLYTHGKLYDCKSGPFKVKGLLFNWEGNEKEAESDELEIDVEKLENNSFDVFINDTLYKDITVFDDGDGYYVMYISDFTVTFSTYDGLGIITIDHPNLPITKVIIAESIDYLDFIDTSDLVTKEETDNLYATKQSVDNLSSTVRDIKVITNFVEGSQCFKYINLEKVDEEFKTIKDVSEYLYSHNGSEEPIDYVLSSGIINPASIFVITVIVNGEPGIYLYTPIKDKADYYYPEWFKKLTNIEDLNLVKDELFDNLIYQLPVFKSPDEFISQEKFDEILSNIQKSRFVYYSAYICNILNISSDAIVLEYTDLGSVYSIKIRPNSNLQVVKNVIATKEYVEKKISDIDITLPDYIEADKLKTPITIWGQEFDGTKDINNPILVQEILADSGRFVLRELGSQLLTITKSETIINNNITWGGNPNVERTLFSYNGGTILKYDGANTLSTNYKFESTQDITSPNITTIESKLEGVTKAADDSKVIKRIRTYNGDIIATPLYNPEEGSENYNGSITIGYGDIIAKIGTDNDILLNINPNGNIATKNDLENKANKSEINEIDIKASDINNRLINVEGWKNKFPLLVMSNISFSSSESSINITPNISSLTSSLPSMSILTIDAATTTTAGVMSATDKTKLDKTLTTDDVKKLNFQYYSPAGSPTSSDPHLYPIYKNPADDNLYAFVSDAGILPKNTNRTTTMKYPLFASYVSDPTNNGNIDRISVLSGITASGDGTMNAKNIELSNTLTAKTINADNVSNYTKAIDFPLYSYIRIKNMPNVAIISTMSYQWVTQTVFLYNRLGAAGNSFTNCKYLAWGMGDSSCKIKYYTASASGHANEYDLLIVNELNAGCWLAIQNIGAIGSPYIPEVTVSSAYNSLSVLNSVINNLAIGYTQVTKGVSSTNVTFE